MQCDSSLLGKYPLVGYLEIEDKTIKITSCKNVYQNVVRCIIAKNNVPDVYVYLVFFATSCTVLYVVMIIFFELKWTIE